MNHSATRYDSVRGGASDMRSMCASRIRSRVTHSGSVHPVNDGTKPANVTGGRRKFCRNQLVVVALSLLRNTGQPDQGVGGSTPCQLICQVSVTGLGSKCAATARLATTTAPRNVRL